MKTKQINKKEIEEQKQFRKLKALQIFKFDDNNHLHIFLADSTIFVHLPSLKRNTIAQKEFHKEHPDE